MCHVWVGLFGFRRVTPKLGMAKVTHVDFPPRETVSYTKETQTPVVTLHKEGDTLEQCVIWYQCLILDVKGWFENHLKYK